MYVNTDTYIHEYIYIHMYIYIFIYLYIYVNVYICVTGVRVHLNMCIALILVHVTSIHKYLYNYFFSNTVFINNK